jgi:type IV pilus assembly protein PilW
MNISFSPPQYVPQAIKTYLTMNITSYDSRTRQRGLTLVEIMVALTLGLVLIAGLLQLFVGTRQSYRTQENLSRVQENGRYALEFISRAVRIAGYRSRNNIEAEKNFDDIFPGSLAVEGANDDAATGNNILDGTDNITIRFEGENGGGDGAVLNCLGGSVTSPIGAPVGARNTLTVTDGNELHCATQPIVGGAETVQPIIDGVEDMQILYGENTDGVGGANQYLSADAVGNMANVASIRVCLVLSTEEDNLAVEAQTYRDCTDTQVTAGDRRLYRRFTTTITLRNLI